MACDPLLLTPGPLTTSATVKQAMLRDLGAWDRACIDLVAEIRRRLLRLALVDEAEWACVPMQGSGTFAIEAAIGTIIPRGGRLLVCANGAYGERAVEIARRLQIDVVPLRSPETEPIDPRRLRQTLDADPSIGVVLAVHCETTTGLMNDAAALGVAARDAGRLFILDAMSSFGAVDLDPRRDGIDVLVSSSNKCIEGVPGFGFVIAPRTLLSACAGRARSLALDLHDQWRGFESHGRFRFTPPTHVLLAFRQALDELDLEGGVPGRMRRYRRNHLALIEGMASLGFRRLIRDEHAGWIITTFMEPDDPAFRFDELYRRLSERGFVIYPGKLTQAACFRVGNIGRIDAGDIARLLAAIAECLDAMGVATPLSPSPAAGRFAQSVARS